MKRKPIVVSRIIHIGKESNDLEKVQTFGLDSNSYVVYENKYELEKKFRDAIPQILKLYPRDLKKFGISRQTLWNVKMKIRSYQLDRVSYEIKSKLINMINL